MSKPLADFALLEDLSHNDQLSLRGYLEEREHDDGETVCWERDESSEALMVLEGKLRIVSGGRSCGSLGSGEVLGALSLTSIGARECSAVAEGPVRLLALTREAYLRMRSDAPQLALGLQEGILRSLSDCVRDLLRKVAEES